ncbi:MAG: hypothetical protein IPG38_18400 [Chitinophagaceae bacterium]|nr:hypothetical protein [Chitinophagaceae bacterium]
MIYSFPGFFIPGNNGFDIPLSGKNHVGGAATRRVLYRYSYRYHSHECCTGNYILISRVNATGNLFESNNNNNLAFKYITIYNPAPSDLIVENVMKPDTVLLGYTFDTAEMGYKEYFCKRCNRCFF